MISYRTGTAWYSITGSSSDIWMGPNSDAIANLYFDRTLRTTAESFWVFGRDIPLQAATAESFRVFGRDIPLQVATNITPVSTGLL